MIENHLKTIETPTNDLIGEVDLHFSCNFIEHAINKCDMEAGMCSHSPNTIQGPRTVDWHVVWFMLDGELDCVSGDQRITLKPGECLICPKGVERTHFSENGYLWFWVKCLKPETWNIHGDRPYHHKLKTGTAIPNLISLIQNEMKEDMTSKVMGNLLEILPILMTREFNYTPVLEDPQRKRLAELWEEIQFNPSEKWSVELCAQKMFVSKGHLHQLTQKYYHCRPMEKVTKIRLLCAEEKLLSSDQSLESIALEVGYGSATAFSNAFYKMKGIRPGDYRNKALSKEV